MRWILTSLWLAAAFVAGAQTRVDGRVTDARSGEPLPYVTIKGVGQHVGATTDFDGFYSFETELPLDSIIAIYLGYETKGAHVTAGKEQTIDFVLHQSDAVLEAVVVKPGGENPALRIMKRASEYRDRHDPVQIDRYEYRSYSRTQLAVDNVSERFRRRRLFREIEPLFDTLSSFTDSSSQKVLPVLISETISDYYFQSSPRRAKELIHAIKIQGVGVGEDSYVSQILGSTFQQYNFYQSNLYILDKDFVSPLSPMAPSYYSFQLLDSAVINGRICFMIQVHPRNQRDLVFKGQIWIDAATYAIKRLNLEITHSANLNFIDRLKIQQECEPVEGSIWLPHKTRVLIDLAEPTESTIGMLGMYYNSIRDVQLDQSHPASFYDERITLAEDASERKQAYWDTARFEPITAEDRRIYSMVDSLKNQPLLRTYVETVDILLNGYVPTGKLEWGPFHYLVGYNPLEGVRTRLGVRTTPSFHKNLELMAYGAYGFLDKRFKYGFNGELVLDRTHWFKMGVDIRDDIELIGLTDENYGTLALFDAFSTFGSAQLSRGVRQRIYFEKELFKGYTQRLFLDHKHFDFPASDAYFFRYEDPETGALRSSFDITSVRLRGTWSYKQQFVIHRTDRLNFGHLKAPVVSLDYTRGFKELRGDFNFDKVGAEIWQFNSLGNLGTFEYTLRAYKVFGTLPYPTLFVMRGNESPLSNPGTYNLMNLFEFAADQYVSLDYEHQFNGLLMNRLPLLRRLKWRSFVNFRSVYGSMSAANIDMMAMEVEGGTNPNLFSEGVPYMEAGYGVENIFRFLRLDFIHRLTYLDDSHPDSRPFGVKFTARLRF